MYKGNEEMLANLDFVSTILLNHHEKRNHQEEPFPEYLQIVNSRDRVIGRFQPELSDVDRLSENTFRDFLSFRHNQHWTGLQRPSSHASDDMAKLRRALKHLFDERVSVADRLDTLTGQSDLSVQGLAEGILTPMLLLRYPDRYGVWNGKSEAALKALKIWPKFSRGTRRGQKYAKLNELFLNLAGRTGLDLWCLDGLWHVINQKSKLDTDYAFLRMELEEKQYFEGRRVATNSQRIERSAEARNECIKAHGLDCMVCGFNFYERYGELGLGYIHVHHIKDLALASENIEVDPRKDLVPVCPNCHAMLHKGVKQSRSIEELKGLLLDSTPFPIEGR